MQEVKRRRGAWHKAGWVVAVAMASMSVQPASAQAPLRIVVPVPPGGGLDTTARLFATHLSEVRGEAVVVENRPGGDAMIGSQFVAKAAPDGRTVLLAATFLATNLVLRRFSFDPEVELAPVVMTADTDNVLVVNAGSAVHSVADLVAEARNRPNGLNCGGAPGQSAMACEQMRVLLKGQATSIPYAGLGPAVNALAAGHVDMMMVPIFTVRALADAGKVRFIAGVDDRKLAPPWDHLPLLRETWPAMYIINFNGIFVPTGTPASVVQALNRDFNQILALPQVKGSMQKAGYKVAGGSPEVLAKALSASIVHTRRVAQQLGIQPE